MLRQFGEMNCRGIPVKEERKLERSMGFGGTMVSGLYWHRILPYTVSDLSDLDHA